MWSSNDVCWMAGLFEGEGTISITKSNRNGRSYARAALGMTDFDVIDRLHRTSGLGGVDHCKVRPNRTKPMYYWRINKRDEIKAFLTAIYPYMGERRSARIQEALDLISVQQSLKFCVWCQGTFEPVYRSNQKYCTRKCAKAATRPYNKGKEARSWDALAKDPVNRGI